MSSIIARPPSSCGLIFELFMFMSGEHKRDVVDALNYWEGRSEEALECSYDPRERFQVQRALGRYGAD